VPGREAQDYKVRILKIDEEREFRWLGHFHVPGLIDGDLLLLQRGPIQHQPGANDYGTGKNHDHQAHPDPDVVQSAEPAHGATRLKIALPRLSFDATLHSVGIGQDANSVPQFEPAQ